MLAEAARARRGRRRGRRGEPALLRRVRARPDRRAGAPPSATLLASPDIDLVLGHHAHVVQPFEKVGGKWVAYGLGQPPRRALHAAAVSGTEDSVIARFTFTRGADGRFTVTRAEAVPLRIELGTDAVRVVPADPESFQRIAGVLDRRGAVAAGLGIRPGLTRAAH